MKETGEKDLSEILERVLRILEKTDPSSLLKLNDHPFTEREKINNALSLLEKQVETLNKNSSDFEHRINNILGVMMAYAKQDFSPKASLKDKADIFDALAGSVNMLGEELQTSTISLNEKEVLLKEIHHRVKNNLQVISSLLSLQASGIEDKRTLDMFRESQSRIKSMALIHEKLYESADISKIDFSEYITALINSLADTYGILNSETSITLVIDIQKREHFLIDTAIPCGLILTEIISNSFKYAFNGRAEGEVCVSLTKTPASPTEIEYRLVIGDNGIGIPPEINYRATQTLGLQLVNSLADQLHAKVDLDTTAGTLFTIKFNVPATSN